MIDVRAVKSRKAMRDFVTLPVALYQENDYFVSRPFLEMKLHLSPTNPYFKHAKASFFVAYDESGKPAGRISAQVNDKAGKGEGHFGFLEAANDEVLNSLVDTAENWLSSMGCQKVVGPFSLSINDESGLLASAFDKQPRIMMNYAHDWYGSALEKQGYQVNKTLLAYDIDTNIELPKSAQYMARQAKQINGFRERPIEMKHFERDLHDIISIFNDAWSDNWGFIPMSGDDIQYMAKNIRPILKPDFARIAYIDDRPVAMVVALPDVNQALSDLNGKLFPLNWIKLIKRLKSNYIDTARILLMGVRKDVDVMTSSAISAKLIDNIQKASKAHNIRTVEMSWILDDNEPTKRLITSMGGVETRRYNMYEKSLSDTAYSAAAA